MSGLRPLALIVLTCLALVLLYQAAFSNSSPDAGATLKMTSHPAAKLSITARQTSSSPVVLTVAVRNDNNHPVTVLTWDSPLDRDALSLGVVSITPAGASAPLDLPRVFFRRVMPPGDKSLVTIEPGATAEGTIEFSDSVVSDEEVFGDGETAKVVLSGNWRAVWPKRRKDVSEEERSNMDGPSPESEFRSGEVEIKRKM